MNVRKSLEMETEFSPWIVQLFADYRRRGGLWP
jgi:hypothetical protein